MQHFYMRFSAKYYYCNMTRNYVLSVDNNIEFATKLFKYLCYLYSLRVCVLISVGNIYVLEL